MSKLTIIRGLPGSGKSTMAKSIDALHIEADMYHYCNGKYEWKPKNLKASHEWCATTAKQALDDGIDVVVSNTFTTLKELRPYIEWKDHEIEIIDCTENYGSVHGVPPETIDKMKKRWISKDDVLFVQYVNKWRTIPNEWYSEVEKFKQMEVHTEEGNVHFLSGSTKLCELYKMFNSKNFKII